MHYLNLDTNSRGRPAWAEALRQHTTRQLHLPDYQENTHSVPELRAWLEAQPETAACLAEAQRKPGESQILYLRSSDPAWLNLPWRKAVTDLPNVQIVATPVLEALPQYAPAIAPPFRILVMISAPVDQEAHRKLDYETEECRIIQALSPLIEQGQVYIDFTDDGSLEALQRKLAGRPYHALHFSGHGIYQNGIGMLELEDPNTLTQQLVPADAFVQALTAMSAHTPPLVVLAACQTAKGHEATDQAGLAHALVRAGVPAIVAMNESIRDDYAILFASRLYQYIAQGETLPYAFKTATEAIRGAEFKEYQGTRDPYQWLIPELLVAKEVLRLVDSHRRPEELLPESHVFEFTDSGVELVLQRGKAFVGRRKERSELLPALAKHKPVLLLGMGGVGKTALAAQLLHALSMQNPGTNLVVFNELTFKTHAVFERLLALLTEDRRRFAQSQLKAASDTAAQMKLILDALRYAEVQVAFAFDNLESFQSGPGQPFQENYADQEAIIRAVAQQPVFQLILTARYPLADIEGVVVRDIHQSSLNDFWKRALHTQLYQTYLRFRQAQEADIQQKISPDTEPITYLGFIQQLHTRLGGNFRLLEYFDGILAERPEALCQGWADLQALENELQTAREGMDSGPRSLALGGLLALLTADELLALQLLAYFRIPVHETALRMQQGQGHLPALATLARMTLIEQQETQPGWISWYAVPLVKDYLEAHPMVEVTFSHEMAGRYYRHAADNLTQLRLPQQEEAFDHFCLAGNQERVAELGELLSKEYFDAYMYRRAFYFAHIAEQSANEAISPQLHNRLGQLWKYFGEYEKALGHYHEGLIKSREYKDKYEEGALLSNTALILLSHGNYEGALKCLKDSLSIMQDVGDKFEQGTLLNNISQIHDALGEFEAVTTSLEQSLRIAREIGNAFLEGAVLNHFGLVHERLGNKEESLRYLYDSLRIRREINDKPGEATTLNNLSLVYQNLNEFDKAHQLLEQSLSIRRSIGDRIGQGDTLANLGKNSFQLKNYDAAEQFYNRSLQIAQEAGEKGKEATILNNVSQIFTARGDYEKALEYLKQSKGIQCEIGDTYGLSISLYNMAAIAFEKQANPEEALPLFWEAHQIFQRIGSSNEAGSAKYLEQIKQQIGEDRFQQILQSLPPA